MGCLGSKDRLTKEDMEFLKTHTRYDEVTIKEWYKGFKVSLFCCLSMSPTISTWTFVQPMTLVRLCKVAAVHFSMIMPLL